MVLVANPSLALLLNSTPHEILIHENSDIKFVKTEFKRSFEGEEKLYTNAKQFSAIYYTSNIYFVGSIIAVQTQWEDINVVSPITTKETSRLSNEKKICYWNKWNCA